MGQVTLAGNSPVAGWHSNHALEYAQTEKRLTDTKAKFMSVSLDEAVHMHNVAYVNTVISQQNPVDNYEPAFSRWVNGEKMDTAFEQVNYSNQKIDWISDTLVDIDAIEDGVKMLRNEQVWDYVEHAIENFTGVAFIKAPFTAAMLGFTSVMCLDTNVAQATETNPRQVDSVEEYKELCQDITQSYDGLNLDPFLLQWVLFDFQRGYHETHRPYFNAQGTWSEADRSDLL